MKPRVLLRSTAVFLFCFFASAAEGIAQTPSAPTQNADQNADQYAERTTADETFDLNIVERRIREANFERATSVEVGGDEALPARVRVGVVASAEQINLLLRGVTGRVRFRASLDPLTKLLNERRITAAKATDEVR